MKNQYKKKLAVPYYKIAMAFIAIQLTSILTSAQTKDSSETQPKEIKVTGVEYGSRGLLFGIIIEPSHLAPTGGETQLQFSTLGEEISIKSSVREQPLYLGLGGSLIEVATGFDSGVFVGGQLGYLKSKYNFFNSSSRNEGAFDPKLYLGFRQSIGSSLLIYRLDYSIYSGINKYVTNGDSSYSNVLFGGTIIRPSFDLRHQLNPEIEFGGRFGVTIFGNSKAQYINTETPSDSTTNEDTTEPAYSLDIFAKYKINSSMDLVSALGISRGRTTKSKQLGSDGSITEYEFKDQAKLDTISFALPIKINEAFSVNPQISRSTIKSTSDETTGDTLTYQMTTANVSLNYGF